MMRLKVARIGEGLHPSEYVVEVRTKSGKQQLFVDSEALYPGDMLSVGWPVGQDQEGAYYLVELPRETFDGSWRVWVPRGDVEVFEEKRRA